VKKGIILVGNFPIDLLLIEINSSFHFQNNKIELAMEIYEVLLALREREVEWVVEKTKDILNCLM
jgi:hypothetical protein